MSASVVLELQVAGAAAGLPDERCVRDWLQDTLRCALPDENGRFEIVVRVVDEAESRELNGRYRRRGQATNVLAFPAAGPDEIPGPASADDAVPLGDLVLCGVVIEREAASQGKALAAHWGHMLVHGALHLLGYDHRTAAEAARMEALEQGILAGRGVADPYAPR